MTENYIHGSSGAERARLDLMNRLINAGCLDALSLGSERLVLDMGAGTGQFTRSMAAALPVSSRIIAVERDPAQREAALAAADGATGCRIDFRLGDATDPPLEAAERGTIDLAHTRFLLEHVPEPVAVVRAMVAALRPGGRIVLADDDHALLRVWPELPAFSAAWRAYYRSYRSLGTDPLVGRKLAAMIHEAGAQPTRTTQIFYGGCAGQPEFPGLVDNLVGVLGGARVSVLATGEIDAGDYDAGLDAIEGWRARPEAALWYTINWAEGRKAR